MFQRRTPVGRNLLATLFVGLLPLPLQAMDVHLKSGSVRNGEPDASTNESNLRLRVGEPDAYIVFGIPWEQIAEIHEGLKVWGPEHFDELRTRWSELLNDEQDAPETERQQSEEPAKSASSRPLWKSPRAPTPHEPSNTRVRFIEIDAVAANWDANDEWDGIVLRVWPLNQSGDVVEVAGTLAVTLTADKGYPPKSDPHGEQIQPIGSWSRSIRVSNYGADGVSVRLPFQDVQPNRRNAAGTDRWHVSQAHPDSWVVSNSGDVHVRFSVPGHGMFTATTSLPVRLRRFSPLRDQYFLRHGTRNFSNE